MMGDAVKVIGNKLASVRAVLFDGRGDKRFRTVNRLELNFGAQRILFGVSSYGELFMDDQTPEEYCNDVIDGLEDLYTIEDLSGDSGIRSLIGFAATDVEQHEGGNPLAIVHFEHDRRIRVLPSEKLELVYEVVFQVEGPLC